MKTILKTNTANNFCANTEIVTMMEGFKSWQPDILSLSRHFLKIIQQTNSTQQQKKVNQTFGLYF